MPRPFRAAGLAGQQAHGVGREAGGRTELRRQADPCQLSVMWKAGRSPQLKENNLMALKNHSLKSGMHGAVPRPPPKKP